MTALIPCTLTGGGGWGFQLTSTLLYKLEGLLTNETSAYTYDHIQHTSGHLPSARNHHSKKKTQDKSSETFGTFEDRN